MSSNWINHVKQYASQKGITYNAALKDSECKSSYHSKKTESKPVSVPKEIVSVLKQIESVPKRQTKKTIINIKPIDENKIKIPHYVNKFMWSKSRDWKQDPINETQVDWATGMTQDENEKQEEKKQKAKKALAQIKKLEAPIRNEVKSDEEIYPISRSEQIRSYVESLPQPSVEQIIKNRAAIRTRYSGIGSLNFKESEFQIEQPKSTGLNYLRGLDDDEIT